MRTAPVRTRRVRTAVRLGSFGRRWFAGRPYDGRPQTGDNVRPRSDGRLATHAVRSRRPGPAPTPRLTRHRLVWTWPGAPRPVQPRPARYPQYTMSRHTKESRRSGEGAGTRPGAAAHRPPRKGCSCRADARARRCGRRRSGTAGREPARPRRRISATPPGHRRSGAPRASTPIRQRRRNRCRRPASSAPAARASRSAGSARE